MTDENWIPLRSGETTALPGLYFCGFHLSPTGMIREIGPEARRIAREILRVRTRARGVAGSRSRPGARMSNVVPIPRRRHSLSLANRWRDWLRQAERDLEQARASREEGPHEWPCFAAHQAAEKAVKALHLRRSQEASGHVVAKLVSELPREVAGPDGLEERARVLDNFYVPSRYPDGHPEGAPFEHYGPLQREQAVQHAGAIIEFVPSQVA